ncbi:MAG: ABC transporter, substrate-binding protein (cluster 8, B12/iron complex), partial [uncultured Nocardioides sp.]
AHRLPPACDHRDPLRHRRRPRGRGGHLRVRLPPGGAQSPDRLHERDARRPGPTGDRRLRRGRHAARRGPLPPRRGRTPRPRRRPGGHPGPLCGLRGRRRGGRRRPRAPRVHGRRPHLRPAHARRRTRLDPNPRRRDRSGERGRCPRAVPAPAVGAGRTARGAPPTPTRGPARVDRPAVRAGPLDPGDDRPGRWRARARDRRRQERPHHVAGRPRGRAGPGRRGAVRLRPCRCPGAGGRGRRPAARRRTRACRRRQRVVGAPRDATARRDRGACHGPRRGGRQRV